MDLIQGSIRHKKNSPIILSVLNNPPRSHLREISSSSCENSLFYYSPKRITLSCHKISIPKSKLLSTLEIYEWRYQTEFPIVKTMYVNVQENELTSQQSAQLTVYNEHCPVKLMQIYEMPMGQCIYMLKESILGFERLYNRFGGFEIMNSMIAVNEKGQCRVWLNEDFAYNFTVLKDFSENKMVNKIVNIFESHSQESRVTKKLLPALRNCQTFLNALISIETFVKESKIIVPTRFATISSAKEIGSICTNKGLEDFCSISSRFSMTNDKGSKISTFIKNELDKSLKARKHSPFQIKRFKSEDLIEGADGMKKSDGETAYTCKLNRTSNLEIQASPKINTANRQNLSYSRKKNIQWMEDSAYVMGEEYNKNMYTAKSKKELSYSEAFKPGQLKHLSESDRKYSCKLSPKKNNSQLPYFNKIIQKPELSNFSKILDSSSERKHSPFKTIQSEEQEKEQLEEHKDNVLKNNGWVPSVSGLMDFPTQLEDSFHEGQEEDLVRDIKLTKLDNIGRKQMQMSVLSEELEFLL